ncbi:MAG: putative MFS family arabinose efflux permease [Hyphomicrobiaceae bacterium]|jgi:predicted MFS family arabinose efflux permease
MSIKTMEGNRRWWVLALLCLSRTGLGFQFQTMGSVSEHIVAELHLNYTEIGTLIGLFMLPGMFLTIPAGFASRFASDRWLTGSGLIVLGIGGAIAAVAEDFGMLAVGRVACGAGFVVSLLYFMKMVADWFSGRELATAMGLLVMTWPLGIAMGQVGHEWLADTFEWRSAFAVAAIYCFAAGALVLLTYRSPQGAIATGILSTWRLPRRELVLTVLASLVWGMFNAGYIVYLSFAPKVLMVGGFKPMEAAATIGLGSLVMMLSGALCGQVADRTGRNDLILYICTASAVLALLMLPFTDYAIGISLFFGLLGMAPAGVIMALTGEAMAPERRAFGMGVFLAGYFVLAAPAPAIAGALYDIKGDPYWPILFGAALFAAAAAANAVFRLVQRRLS